MDGASWCYDLGEEGRASVGFWLGWWGIWQRDCHPLGGLGAGAVETPVVGFYLFLYPTECGFSPGLLSQGLTALGYLPLPSLVVFLIKGRVG